MSNAEFRPAEMYHLPCTCRRPGLISRTCAAGANLMPSLAAVLSTVLVHMREPSTGSKDEAQPVSVLTTPETSLVMPYAVEGVMAARARGTSALQCQNDAS